MRISKLIKLLVVGFVALAGLNLTSTLLTRYANERLVTTYDEKHQFVMAVRDLRQASDELTSWSREYAVSGSHQAYMNFWHEVHEERRNERSMEVFYRLGAPHSEMELIQRASSISDDIVMLNDRAFAAIAAGDAETAIDIMFGAEYAAGVLLIEDTLGQLYAAVLSRTATYLDNAFAKAAFFETLVLISSVAFGVFGVSGALIIFRKIAPIKEIVKHVQNLTDGNVNINIRKDLNANDEIGKLMLDVYALAGTLDGLQTYFNDLRKNILAGKTYSRASGTGMNGIYATIIEQVNGITNDFEFALDQFPEPYFCINGEMQVTHMNIAARKFVGMEEIGRAHV